MTKVQVSTATEANTTPSKTRQRGRWVGWGFMGPFMIVFLLVFVAPVVYSIYLSVFQDPLIGPNRFVGFANYIRAFNDPQFLRSLWRVALFLVVQVPIMLGIALFVALALDSGRLHGKAFFRISIFMPYAVPAVVATLMWGFIYGTRFGLIGNLNNYLGWNLPNPMSPDLVLIAIGNIVTWEFVGYNMLIFYAALRTIPPSLYEAATIDGAGQFRIITAIKIPSLRGALVIATIFSIIGSFQLFNEPNIMRALAPNAITTHFTPNMYAYSLSFSGQQYNYAATIAMIMGVVTMIVAYIVQIRGLQREDV